MVFVSFLGLAGQTILVNVADNDLAELTAIPAGSLPVGIPNGTNIDYDDGRRIQVQGTPAATATVLAGGGVAPSNAVYVDLAGNDATGQRGSSAFPFLTMAAALAVAHSGDEVLVSPGTYSGAFTVNLANLIIRGAGEFVGDTILTAANAVDVCTLGAACRSILFDTISVSGATTGRGIIGTGAAAATLWLSSGFGLVLQDSSVSSAAGNALDLTYASIVTLRTTLISGPVALVTCGTVTYDDAIHTGALTFSFDSTDVLKPVAQGTTSILGGSEISGTVTMGGQARLSTRSNTSIGNLTALNLSVAAGPVSPSITVNGKVGTVDLSTTTAALPSPVLGAYTVSFAGATIGATFLARVASGATRQPVSLVGALNAGAIAITSDALVDIVAQGAAFKTPTYTCLNTGALGIGTLQPPSLTLTAANANPTTFTFPNTLNVPTGYGVAAINSTAAGAVTAATTMSATQVITTHAGATGNTTITLLWP